MAEGAASRAALLALKRDRQVIEEGHRFLDEKRVALAHELLRRLRDYASLRADFLARAGTARAAFAAGVGRHGLEGLQVQRPLDAVATEFSWRDESFLGAHLPAGARLAFSGTPQPRPLVTPEAERCANAFRELAIAAAPLAGAVAGLLRLMAEYGRTERRVRALENVVLPEARREERLFETALEELDQEEVMRSRRFAAPL